MRPHQGSSRDALCCCEYMNLHNERSHILECCCDCQVVDSLCDRLLTCRHVPKERVEEMFETIEDRCRIPSFTGKGAVKIKLDIAIPVFLVPSCLLVATLSSFFTTMMMIFLPVSLFLFYRLWMKRPEKNRTRIFYVWGLVSAFQMYLTFEFVVFAFRKVLLWENMIVSTLFFLTLYALYHAKKGPGYLRPESCSQSAGDAQYKWKQQQLQQMLQLSEMENAFEKSKEASLCGEQNHAHHGRTAACANSSCGTIKNGPQEVPDSCTHLKDVVQSGNFKPEFGLIGNILMQNFGFGPEGFEQNMKEEMERMSGQVIPEEEVTWVDSRMTQEGFLVTWCQHCKLHKLPRSGHCPVCDVCVEGRDHHCVWIDSCVGARNHRAFFLALLLFLIGSTYGINLTLTTICTPEMYLDWFLLPSNCDYVYADFPTALCWVSACYSIISVVGMSCVMLQQCIFISQDITSQELHTSWRRGWGYWMCFSNNNNNNRGCLRNWVGFLSGRRKRNQVYPSVSV